MSLLFTEDVGLKKAKNPVRFKVREQSPIVYARWRQSGGHFWAARESIDFLDRLMRIWLPETQAASASFVASSAGATAGAVGAAVGVAAGAAGAAAGAALGVAAGTAVGDLYDRTSNSFVPRIFLGDIGKKGGGTWANHLSHAEGTQIDIYYITIDGTNRRILPTKAFFPNKSVPSTKKSPVDVDWGFHTEMNARLLRAILKCRPYRVLTQVPSMLNHPDFSGNRRIEFKKRHWDHFHIDVVRQIYQRGKKLPDQSP